jgi:hypothetical protein
LRFANLAVAALALRTDAASPELSGSDDSDRGCLRSTAVLTFYFAGALCVLELCGTFTTYVAHFSVRAVAKT